MPTPVVREGQPRTNTWTCGKQPSHQSLFTRVPGHVSTDRPSVIEKPTEEIGVWVDYCADRALQKDIRAMRRGTFPEIVLCAYSTSAVGPRGLDDHSGSS